MTQLSCPTCRLRFTRAAAAFLTACPECDAPLEPVLSAEHVMGFRLAGDDDAFDVLPVALAAALTDPERIGPAVEPER